MDFLKQQSNVDPTRIAAIGYCMGSTVVLNMAGQGIESQVFAVNLLKRSPQIRKL